MMKHRTAAAWRALLPLCAVLLSRAPAAAFAQEYRIGVPVPAWILRLEADLEARVPEEGISDGLYYLLNEKQVDFTAPGRERFFHEAYVIANGAGLENAGTLTVDFDPSYERLALHFLRVRRGGRIIDARGKARTSVIQREPNLEYRIFDGAKTFTALLPDLRVGDVVEYAYTIAGSNPVFGDRSSDFWFLQGTAGVRRAYYRALFPAAREIACKSFGRLLEPSVTRSAGKAEYVWDVPELGALLPDENLPDWHFVYPAVQVSDWGSWGDVAAWAFNLYRPLFAMSSAVAKLARELAAGAASEEEAIAAFIGYVQDEVRYLGIESGVNSHRPNPPDLVSARRFGDCKDKSVLLAALCRARGIEAYPTLVNTYMRARVADYLPGPGGFDHVIVLIKHAGREYWIDPTVTLQATSLGAIAQAGFGSALVVAGETAGLTALPPASGGQPTIVITENIDLSSGNAKPAALVVSTVYTGETADNRRRYFALNSRQKIQKDFLAYYSDFFKDIESSAALVVTDDRARNELSVTESYSIRNPWVKDDKNGEYDFNLYPEDLNGHLRKPKSIKRSAPYAIAYPLHVRAVKLIRLPRVKWNLQNESFEVKNESIAFSTSFTYARSAVECRFEYRALRDFVPAEGMAAYAADLEKIDEHINFSLNTADPDAPDPAAGDSSGAGPSLITEFLIPAAVFLLGPLVFLVVFTAVRRARRLRQ